MENFDDDRKPIFHWLQIKSIQGAQTRVGSDDILYSAVAGPDKTAHSHSLGIEGSEDLEWWRSPFILMLHQKPMEERGASRINLVREVTMYNLSFSPLIRTINA